MKAVSAQAAAPILLLRVFAPFTTVYLLSELLRNVGGVAAPAIQDSLSIDAGQLGLLTSVFMVAIAVLQVPVGMLLDRFGSRRVVSLFLVLAAIGTIMFTGDSYAMVVLGRFLTGAGLAACWVGAYKANALWWSPQRATLVNGALLGLSGLGALAATLPTAIALDYMTWRALFRGLAIAIAALAALIWWCVPDHPEEGGAANGGDRPKLSAVLREPLFWRVAPVVLLCEGTWMAYQGLWAGVWMRQVDGFSAAGSANRLMWLAGAVVIGQLLLGALADALNRRGVALDRVMAVVVGVFITAQALLLVAPPVWVGLLWIVFGLCTAGSVMAYGRIAQALSPRLMGRAVALLNMCGAGAAFGIQCGIGWFVELWPAGPEGHAPAAAHVTALAGLVVLQGLAWLWMCAPRRRVQSSAPSRVVMNVA
ncbi:MAG: MFS transporter [Salinisphaera sp.]|uniref:MFS transporter n=1 Tax=Salinisphaera sp. TaxID=1914330 RepID=UPI003C7B4250